MPRRRSTASLLFVLALLCASFASQRAPVLAQTEDPCAGFTPLENCIVVNYTLDDLVIEDPNDYCDQARTLPCNLRAAITKANSIGGTDPVRIAFGLETGVPGYESEPIGPFTVQTWTLTVDQPLPALTRDSIAIDGQSQEDFVEGSQNQFGPTIIIDGSNLTQQSRGLTINSSNNTITKLGIANFADVGIEVTSFGDNPATGNTIAGCYIGVDKVGISAAPNATGIRLRSNNNTVSGTIADPSLISGNLANGILIEDASGNQILGNYIGLDLTGNTAVPNGQSGVALSSASGNTIQGNVISGNNQNGITLFNGENNQILGNLIGLNTSATGLIGNQGHGVEISSDSTPTTGNQVGASSSGGRNIITGNGGAGVRLSGDPTEGNRVQNNYIGTTSLGNALFEENDLPLFTQVSGVLIENSADNNLIGGTGLNEGNVIAGIDGAGVEIIGQVPGEILRGNQIIGNRIGVSRAQSVPVSLGNVSHGIFLNGTPGLGGRIENTQIEANTIGSSGFGAEAIGHGVYVIDSTAQITGTQILSNAIGFLGTPAEPGDPAPNSGAGILVESDGTLTGTINTRVDSNVIGANLEDGITLLGALNTSIENNNVRENGASGIEVDGGSLDTLIRANQIFSNTVTGVGVFGTGTRRTQIVDNAISGNGVPQSGPFPLAAPVPGIVIEPATPGLGGDAANPNHDIDPPFELALRTDGRLTGRVYTVENNPASCMTCTLQFFTSNPATLDGQGLEPLTPPVTIDENGFFTATLGLVPHQLAVTATDSEGNTSAYAVFTTEYGIEIGPARAGTASPGDVISYTHRITNTGTVHHEGNQDLNLLVNPLPAWEYTIEPQQVPVDLGPGESYPVTLTLTLPTGSDEDVRGGLLQQTGVTVQSTSYPTATDTVTDTTLVESSFVIDVDPGASEGDGIPGEQTIYQHRITNIGNITGTVTLSATTFVEGFEQPTWVTTVVPTQTVELGPGEFVNATVAVSIPAGTTAGTVGDTQVTITASDPSQSQAFSDRTTVLLVPRATIVEDQEGDAAAGEAISFTHTVENSSNGPPTLSLRGSSSLGSEVTFELVGGTLGPDNSFTVGTEPGENTVDVIATIRVSELAEQGDTDTITISLLDDQGRVLDTVVDRINVTRPAIRPRIWMPQVIRQ